MGMFTEDMYYDCLEDLYSVSYEDIELEFETEKAWLFKIDGSKYWVPKSLCNYHQEEKIVEIAGWFDEKMEPVG